ncbi:MAG TPA: HAMP domain-containing sensor histidine kinase [Verrucomicrobiales bacterium]|nr:HAMP domain-containing sensor histidine kinase [Verrucomicrobiales bacterium]
MKTFLSLRWKILGWFLVNLLVIGVVLYFIVRLQFGAGLGWLLEGATGDRLETLGQSVITEFQQTPPATPASALDKVVEAWRARGVQAALFRTGPDFVEFAAGDFQELPEIVRTKLRDQSKGPRPGRGGPGGPGGAGRDGAPRPDGFDGPGGPPPDFGDRPPPRSEERRGRFSMAARPAGKFILASDNPRFYWAGVRLGSLEKERTGGGMRPPLTLLLRSDSMRGGGLFFDYYPLLAVGGGLLLVSVLLWLPMIGRLTGALGKLTASAEEIARGKFDAPPVLKRQDELGRLNRAHRHMAGKLSRYVEDQQRFLGDTAHELLSPLARLEVALSILEQRAGDDGQRYVTRALTETHLMTSLLHELLSFTKAGLGGTSVSLTSVALAPMVREIAAREMADGAPGEIRIEVSEHHVAMADAALLDRAIANGLRNAIRYAGDCGPVEITSRVEGDGKIALTVSDSGPGVPEEMLDRLFDPFFRPDVSRVRETGGTGLGLAIVKSAIEACGGSVSLRNREPQGLELKMSLTAGVQSAAA